MPDKKVIKGLESLHKRLLDAAKREPIAMLDAIIVSDALVLLKEQEPRVMAGAKLTDAELIEEIRKAPIVLKPAVDAIPVVWFREKIDGYASRLKSRELDSLVTVLTMWQKEQEAQDE